MVEKVPSGLRQFNWDDLQSLVDLGAECAEFDDTGELRSAESLRTMLSLPGRNPEDTIHVLSGPGGGLIAECGAWFLRGIEIDTVAISVQIHPGYRDHELYSRLLAVAAECGGQICTSSNRPTELHVSVHENQTQLKNAVEAAGYKPVRWFIQMLRDLNAPIPDTRIPDGITIHPFDRERDSRALKLALDESFLDHWNSIDFSEEQFEHWISSPSFRSDLSLVAYAEDGDPAAGCIGVVREGYNLKTGSAEGHINTLGVRRPYRGRGLAKAMLSESFRRLLESGMNAVSLEVDADNPTGATGLYTTMGFVERRRSAVYARSLKNKEGGAE